MEIISKAEAREKGLKRYFTGEPCKHGHVAERRVSNGGCCECSRIRAKRYNDERSPAYRKYHSEKYREKYREKLMIEQRERRKGNLEYCREYDRKRYYANPERRKAALLRGSLTSFIKRMKVTKTDTLKRTVGYSISDLAEDMALKMSAGMSWDNHGEWHIDHIYPVIRFLRDGVTCPKTVNSLDNLIPMWAEHNIAKSDKTLAEWLSEKGEDSEEYKLYSRFL